MIPSAAIRIEKTTVRRSRSIMPVPTWMPATIRVFAAMLAVALPATAASDLEVAKIRVPADRVRDWFPVGTELRGYTLEEFDRLVGSAKAASVGAAEESPATPVRAVHSLRWRNGVLTGTTRFFLRRNRPGGGWTSLSAWSPAVVDPRSESPLRSDGGGRPGIAISPSTDDKVEIEWTLAARPNSGGRLFDLALPSIAATRIDVELPANLTADLTSATRAPSAPASTVGARVEGFLSGGGALELRLREISDSRNRPGDRPWVGGACRVVVDRLAATWTAEWTVQSAEFHARPLVLELDPALILVAVEGSDVRSHEIVRVGETVRLVVAFRPGPEVSRTFRIRGVSRVPLTGAWTIPAARPIDSIWLGGQTTLLLDPGRTVTSCRVDSGRQIAPTTPPTAAHPLVLAFESVEPASRVEIGLKKSGDDVVSSTLGAIVFEERTARATGQIQWTLPPGAPPSFEVDVTGGWSVSRVETAGDEEPLPWRVERTPGGRSRVTIASPPLDDATQTVAVNILAALPINDLDAPLELPRMRPVGAIQEDERWIAITDANHALEPTFAPTLARLVPQELLAVSPKLASLKPPDGRVAAWRWLGDATEGRVKLTSISPPSSPTVEGTATFQEDRIELEWRIQGESATGDGLVVVFDPPPSSDVVWTDGLANGMRIAARTVDAKERETLGIPVGRAALRLRPALMGGGRYSVIGRATASIESTGTLPLPVVAGPSPSRCRQKIRWPRSLPVSIAASGVRVVSGERDEEPGGQDGEASDSLVSQEFSYEDPTAKLTVKRAVRTPGSVRGMVREAYLTSVVEPGKSSRNRLLLQASGLSEGTFDLQFPPDVTIESVLRDGQAIETTRRDGRLRLPLGPISNARSFVIDYRRNADPLDPSGLLKPDLPSCVPEWASFCWELVAPSRWEVEEATGGLRVADWPERSQERAVTTADIGSAPTKESSLCDWFQGIDPENRPIVVDRIALLESGWGPRSRVVPEKDSRWIESLGLSLVAFPGARLVTTRAVASSLGSTTSPELAARVVRAAASGSDADDRFQSVERWRGESTPRGFRSSALESWPWPTEDRVGWTTRRFVAGSRPSAEAGVRLRDRDRIRGVSITAGALAFLCGSILSRRKSILAFPLYTLLAVSGAAAWNSNSPAWSDAGRSVLLGLGAGMTSRLSASRRRDRAGAELESRRSTRSGPAVISGASLLVLLLGGAAVPAVKVVVNRIPAILPFDGVPGPLKPTDRVVIRLEDDRRLREAARTAPAAQGPTLTIGGATHRISGAGDNEVLVESVYNLILDGDGPAHWSFPAGETIELGAKLNGVDAALAIQPDASAALVVVDKPGLNVLRITRRARSRPSRDGNSISLPIVPCVAAKVEMVGPTAWSLNSARTPLEKRGDETAGLLGPVDTLVLSRADALSGANPALTSAEALTLWDSTTAGDLARVVLTLRGERPIDVLRISTDPGSFVMPESTRGLFERSLGGAPAKPEWVARFDDPIPPGGKFSFRIWRPVGTIPGSTNADAPPRSMPRFGIVGIGSLGGVVALRRPPDWRGRLGASPDGVAEQAFVEQWGGLPNDALTLSGTARFAAESLVAVNCGPAPTALRSSSSIDLVLEEGRAVVTIETALQATSGEFDHAETTIPEALRVLRIVGGGLTFWERSSAGRITFRFDGVRARVRRIKVVGVMDVPPTGGPASDARQTLRLAVPVWSGASSRDTSLAIASATRADLEALGAPLLSTGSSSSTTGDSSRTVAVYKIDPRADSVTVRWAKTPPRLSVVVRGRLEVVPGGVEWTADLVYEVDGDPIDSLFLKLPKSWSEKLKVSSVGHAFTTTVEPRGDSVVVRLKPEAPIENRVVVQLKSSRALTATSTIDFPDVAPLGQGAVEKHITLEGTSPRKLQTESSPGLIAEPPAAGDPFGRASSETTIATYRVVSEPWSLRVKVEPEEREERSVANFPIAPVREATILVTRLEDGSTWGEGRFDVDPVAGSYLGIDMPTRAEFPEAVVDGRSAPILLGTGGTRVVPLTTPTIGRVVVCWRTPPREDSHEAIPIIPIPRVHGLTAAPFVSIQGPENGRPRPSNSRYVAIDEADWWLDASERRAKRLAGVASNLRLDLDRVRDALVDGVAEWLLLNRQATRAVLASGRPSARTDVARLDEAGVTLFETLERLGIDDLGRAALLRAGQGVPGAEPSDRASKPDFGDRIRVRKLGKASHFRPAEPRAAVSLFLWERDTKSAFVAPTRPWSSAVALAVLLLVPLLAPRRILRLNRAVTSAIVSIWIAALLLQPGPTILMSVAFATGRLSDDA